MAEHLYYYTYGVHWINRYWIYQSCLLCLFILENNNYPFKKYSVSCVHIRKLHVYV